MNKRVIIFSVIFIFVISIIHADSKNENSTLHYEKGLSYLDNNQLVEAYNEFNIAYNNTSDSELLDKINIQKKNISDIYQNQTNEKFKKLIVANKAGFKSDDDYKAFLNRVNFENFYLSLNRGYETNYFPGDLIVAPAQRLSITDVEKSPAGYLYLVTGYGQNQLSKCCMVVSDTQLQYVTWYGEGLITEKLYLSYQGKSSYKRGYTIVDCDLFTVVYPFSPVVKELSDRINESVKFEKWDFNYILEKMNSTDYQNLLENNYNFVLNSEAIQKLCYACTGEIIDASNKKEQVNYKEWYKVFDYILSSPIELTKKDYWWLCETFNSSDEFNSYFEKYIDKAGVDSKWFHDSYLYNKKNFNTVMSHLSDVKSASDNYWHYLYFYGIDDETIIKKLIQKGLDCSFLTPSNYSIELESFIGHQTPATVQLFIDNGFDINTFLPLWGDNGEYLLTALIELYDQEERCGDPHRIRKDTIDFLIKKGAKQ